MSEKWDDDQRSDQINLSDDEQNGTEEQDEFSFLRETCKDEQVTSKKLWKQIGKTAGRGLIFGVVACLVFCALKPWVEPFFYKSDTVTFPEDDEDSEQSDPGDEGDENEDAHSELTVEDYQELHAALYKLALDAGKSVVEVHHSDEPGIKNTDYEDQNSVSGMIIWNGGSEILVLTSSRITKDDKSLQVAFCDGSQHPATLKKRDMNLGMAVLSVNRKAVSEETLGQIRTAVFGNSNLVKRGDPVVALGKQFGYSGGIGYGIITSDKNKKIMTDRTCEILTTDIATSANGSGVLFNIDGEVIGLIDQHISLNGERILMTAYAVSDIKKDIELLSNGRSVPYLGISGMEVTDEISEENEIPQGVYVSEVAADSPAMAAGIQSGDVLTTLNGSRISTVAAYEKALLNTEPGHEIKIKAQRHGAENYVDLEFTVTVGSME